MDKVIRSLLRCYSQNRMFRPYLKMSLPRASSWYQVHYRRVNILLIFVTGTRYVSASLSSLITRPKNCHVLHNQRFVLKKL